MTKAKLGSMSDVERRLRTLMVKDDNWLNKNPVIANPIGALHDLIGNFASELSSCIHGSSRNQALHDMHKGLTKAILRDVPNFVPFVEVDEAQCEGGDFVSFYKAQKLDAGGGEKIYLDRFADAVQQ